MKKIIIALCLAILTAGALFAENTIKLKASQELYYTDYEEAVINASDNGIYPVRLTVTVESADRTLYVKVYRATTATGPFTLILDSMQPNSEYFDLYDSTPMRPGIKYYYKAVLGKDNLQTATPSLISNVAIGWGALTHEAFYVFFNTTLKKSPLFVSCKLFHGLGRPRMDALSLQDRRHGPQDYLQVKHERQMIDIIDVVPEPLLPVYEIPAFCLRKPRHAGSYLVPAVLLFIVQRQVLL